MSSFTYSGKSPCSNTCTSCSNVKLITTTNGLRLPFSSITSKVASIKPSSSLNCSTSAFERPAGSGYSNLAPKSSNLAPAASASFQENSNVNLNCLSTKANLNDLRSGNSCHLFQNLPQVNLDSSTSFPCVGNIGSSDTFKVQSPLSSAFSALSDVNLNSFRSSLTSNINNVACDSKNMFMVQNPIPPKSLSESFNSKASVLSSTRNYFGNTFQFQTESPTTPVNVNNNVGYAQNAVSSNYCQDLPEVNLNRNPSFYSGFGSTTLSVPNTVLNPDFKFISNEFLSPNPFSIASLPAKSIPVNSNIATPYIENNGPQNSIPVSNQNQGFLPNEFSLPNAFSSQISSLSSLQNKLDGQTSYLEPQLSYNPTLSPTCNILSLSAGSSSNNIFTSNNFPPLLQSNFNYQPSSSVPGLHHSSSTCNNLPSKLQSWNNVPFNSNLNTVPLPSVLASPSITKQSENSNNIKPSENLHIFSPFLSKTSTDFIGPQNFAFPYNILTSNAMPGVSLEFNTNGQSHFPINSNNIGANRNFINTPPNIQLESSYLKPVTQLSSNQQENRIPTNTINSCDSYSLTNIPSFSQIKESSGIRSLFENVVPPEVNISPKWSSLYSIDDLGLKSQIIPSQSCVSTTGSFSSNFNTLSDVTFSPLNINSFPLTSSTTFDQLTTQSITPFKVPQNFRGNLSLSAWLDNLPIAQVPPSLGLSIPSTLNINPSSSLSDFDDVSSLNCFSPFQVSEFNLPQVNPFSKTLLSSSGATLSTDFNKSDLQKIDFVKDNNLFIGSAAPSNEMSCVNPQDSLNELLISTTLPKTVVSQPSFGNVFQSLPNINAVPSVNQLLTPCNNMQLQKNPIPTKLYDNISVTNSCPDTISPFFNSNSVNSFSSSPNSLSSISSNLVNLPNCGIFNSVPCSKSNQAINFEAFVSVPDWTTFYSDPLAIKNNVPNNVPVKSLPDVFCNNNAPVYHTTVSSNDLSLSPLTSFDVPTYSIQSLPSVCPVNYINTCPDILSPMNELASTLTKSILNAVFSGELPLKPKSKIPMSLPPVNPYSVHVTSIPNSCMDSSVFLETPNKSFLEYPQSFPSKTNFSPYEELGYDSYSNNYIPLTSDLAWSDVSNDFSSKIPLNNLPSVNPYMNYCNGNVQPTTPSYLLSSPYVSSIMSSNPQSELNVPPDNELLFDTYPDLWRDNVDIYDSYKPEIFSVPGTVVDPDYTGLMPFVSDLSFPLPSFLPPPNIMPNYPYPAPVLKIPDSRDSKELEQLLEYIVMLELIDNNYDCDWDLLERIIAMLCVFD